jgi:hypothetical protein
MGWAAGSFATLGAPWLIAQQLVHAAFGLPQLST